MRNSDQRPRNTWATYCKVARSRARLSQVQLADSIGVSRQTIGRWEAGRFGPDSAAQVVKFARVTGVDPEEALAAAGFRPDIEVSDTPTREPDPELEAILDAPVDARTKQRMIQYLERLREQDAERRREIIRMMIEREAG